MKKSVFNRSSVALAIASILYSSSATTAKEFVSNGGFETTLGGSASFFLGNGPASLKDWIRAAPPGLSNELVFAPGAADTTGATRSDSVQFGLWGPGNGISNGLPATSLGPTGGGNFVALDGDINFNVALEQNITGLKVGKPYQLSFLWAAAQFRYINYGGSPPLWTGDTTNSYQVSLGSQTFTTPVLSILSQGFSGWTPQTFTFTPTSASAVLSFLAVGSPDGLPPVALLDNVSLVGVPEPTSLLLVGVGLLGSIVVRRLRSAKSVAP